MNKFLRSMMALVLVMVMMVQTSTAVLAADLGEDTIKYVSLGASNVNGYGMRGYLSDVIYDNPELKEIANIYGYKQQVEDSYPDRIADYLESNGHTVIRNELAMSSMRAEELRFLLDDTYQGDKYTDWRFVDIPGYDERASQNWFLNAGRLELGDPSATPEVALIALKDAYKTAVEEADLITLDIGINNFGVYASNQIVSGMYENDLANIDPELKAAYEEGKAYVFGLLEEHVGEALALLSKEQLNHIADTMAYALVGFCESFDAVMAKITELNPDAKVVVVSIQNLMHGLNVALPNGELIPFGDAFAALINAANVYTAILSPYANRYVYADVRANGHVDFFIDELLRYDGDPASLSQDMKDCFDVYDNDLYIKTRVQQLLVQILEREYDPYVEVTDEQLNNLVAFANGRREGTITIAGLTVHEFMASGEAGNLPYGEILQPYYDTYELVLNAAYDVMAEIMQAAVKIDVLDMNSFGQSFGPVEDGLIGTFFGTLEAVAEAVIADPTYTFTLPEGYIDDIAVANDLDISFVNTVASMGVRTGIGNSFYGHPTPDGHAEIADAVISALENEITGKDVIADEIDKNAEIIESYVKEYYDEAYEYAYQYAKQEGYIEVAIDAIDKAIEAVDYAIEWLTDNDTEITDEFTQKLIAELEASKVTLEKIKVILAEDKISNVEDLEAVLAEFEGDLDTHFELIKEILLQGELDVKNLVVPEIKKLIEATKVKLDKYLEEAEAMLVKVGHKHYEKAEDNYYVAIGGDTVRGVGIGRDDDAYYDLLAKEFDIDKKVVTDGDTLLASEVLALVEANAEEIKKADLITYQADASAFIYALVLETPQWERYVDEETAEIIEKVIDKTTEILTTNWDEYAELEIEKVIADVKAHVMESVSEYYMVGDIVDAVFDSVVELGMTYIKDAMAEVEGKKDEVASKIEELNNLNETVKDLAEKLAYAVVAYAVDTVKTIETIQAINPDAALYIVGMYNPLTGLEIVTEDATIDAGEIFGYVIDATKAYYIGYAAVNGNVAYVDVAEAKINGFTEADAIDITSLDVTALGGMVVNMSSKMHANAEGHEYIKDQIIKSMTCDYSVYEAVDAENHAIKCSICGDLKELEAHSFEDDKCTKCGYEKEIIPEDPEDPEDSDDDDDKKPSRPSFVGSAGAPEKTNVLTKFKDLDKSAWYYEYIKMVVEKGLMKGISDTDFAPNATLTRAMFVTILHRVENTPKAEGELKFTDVAAGQYYADAVKWATANGIISGMTDTEFAPNAEITREQMATIIARYANVKKLTVKAEGEVTYTDADQVADYAKEAVVTAKHLGVLIGNDDGSFAPKRNTTRAEAAALFVRLLDVIGK